MAHCKACNAEYTETKNTKGQWIELCGYCNQASSNEAAHVLEDLAYRVAFRASQGSLAERWEEALGSHRFSAGLGLRLSQEATEAHLRQRATEAFWVAVDNGCDFQEAKEAALGSRKFRGDQTPKAAGGSWDVDR